MKIRHLSADDNLYTVSHIYEESWKCAYRDILPAEYLRNLPAGHWVPYLKNAGRESLVLVEDQQIIGTSSYCASRSTDFKDWGEIVSIYLLPEYTRKGYGQSLLRATMDELQHLGFHDIFLWVLEENLGARQFYEKMGFQPSGRYLNDNISGKALREIQYCYHI